MKARAPEFNRVAEKAIFPEKVRVLEKMRVAENERVVS